ncbi:hypothetical protein BDW69DRAFT_190589 [Aspergillus filifer]
MTDLTSSTKVADAKEALKRIRSVAGVISYLNYPINQRTMVKEAHEVEKELKLADDAWVALGNKEKQVGVLWWRLFYKDLLETRSADAKKFIEKWCREMKNTWGTRTTYTALSETHFAKILELIELLIKEDVRRYKDRNGTSEEREAARAALVPSYQSVVHDDKDQFDGMSLDDIRLHYQQYVEDVPVGQAG